MVQQTIHDDVDQLAAAIATVGAGIVMIDGCARVGKTRLARMLAKRLDAAAIDADCHINRGQDAFIAALRVAELKAAIDAARAGSKIVLVSGICARDIAEKAGVTPSMFVYVLRKTAAGVEGDMDIMDAEHGRRRSEPGLLQAELTDYHRRRKPRRNANIVYIRVEPDPPDPADVCAPSSRTLY